jgi:NAD(P) transhydrogenase subunit alpha
LVGLLEPAQHLQLVRRWVARRVTAVSLELLPRTLSRAQSMDVLTSQANIAGYRAAVLAAATYGGFFPMLSTAAGTVRPAAVLVLGAGVAGLQAMGTAHRLGALVTGYDVRPDSRAEVESVGARFLDLGDVVSAAAGSGGYARALSAQERDAQQQALDERVGRFDVVITTARVPGKRPPVLVTETALKGMRAGSVVLDLAASDLGGNVEGSVPDSTLVTDGGVTVIGAANLAASMAPAASSAYARNLAALLTHLVRDGALAIDPADEIAAAVTVTHAGAVVNAQVARLLAGGVS